MQDRVATYPNRWRLTAVTGETDVYDLTREDDATVVGTPLNKATFLPDTTAAAIAALSGNTPTLPSEALDEIASLLGSMGVTDVAHLETGSYTGAGVHGQNNPNTLTFTYKPRLVAILKSYSTAYFPASASGLFLGWQYGQTGGYQGNHFTLTDNVLSWYSTSNTDGNDKQMNTSGDTYYYLAVGVN